MVSQAGQSKISSTGAGIRRCDAFLAMSLQSILFGSTICSVVKYNLSCFRKDTFLISHQSVMKKQNVLHLFALN